MLTTYHFLFVTRVVEPLELDDHSGAALRGNLFEALWKRFCSNKLSPSCADCPLHTTCPVSALVAPLREENIYGRDVPRPYIILPPLGKARLYQPGDPLLFGLTLFGSIIQLLPYIVMSASLLEENGLGRKVLANGGKRGHFRIQQIEAYHPFTGERRSIYQRGKPIVQAPTIAITAEDVATRAAQLPSDQVTLDLLTPTRIVDQESLLSRLTFSGLLKRLRTRLGNLVKMYGEPEAAEELLTAESDLVRRADAITCVRDETRWEDVRSYSRRQRAFTPVGGLLGQITFAGDLAPYRELLVWGELIHVGKSVVKGNGWYKMVLPERT